MVLIFKKSEEGIDIVFNHSNEDLRFAADQSAFYKALSTTIAEFSKKIQKLVKKQDATKLASFPTGYVSINFCA